MINWKTAWVILWMAASSVSAFGLCVKVKMTTLRMGPSEKTQKSWEVARFMPFKKVEDRGKWFQVQDLDGDRHWVRAADVSDKLRCAVVISDTVELRVGPGRKYHLFTKYPAKKLDSFRVLKKKKKYVLVTDDYRNRFWIPANSLWMP